MLAHRNYRQRRAAPLFRLYCARSIGRRRSLRSERGSHWPGPGFFETVSYCPARRLERVVEFVAGKAFGDSQNNRGAFNRALVEMACHDCPANTQSRAGARLMSLEMTPGQARRFTGSPASAVRRITQFLPPLIGLALRADWPAGVSHMGKGGAREPRLRIGAASARRCCGSCWPGNRRNPLFRRSGCRPNDLQLKIRPPPLWRRVALIVAHNGQAGRRRHGDADAGIRTFEVCDSPERLSPATKGSSDNS